MPAMPLGKQRTVELALVVLDAMGTLVRLEPPWEHLATVLGVIPQSAIEEAMRAEMAYYRAHSHEGRDAESLASLRERSAEVLSRELGQPVSVETMMAAIRFQPYPDAAPALEALRARGLRTICVSNWDYALPEVLERCGLAELLDGVVTSAEAGASKPDPAIFERALSLAGCPAAQAIHVGDSLEEDVQGARAAGVRAVLLDRDGGRGDISSLTELEGLAA
jgi:putative hydrolase of the HAD superfamily